MCGPKSRRWSWPTHSSKPEDLECLQRRQPQRVLFFKLFRSENGYRLRQFWSGIGYGFRGNYDSASLYSSFQFQISKKERVISEFEIDFKKSFRWVSNLGKDDIISVYLKIYVTFCGKPHVWKLVWILDARSENGCGKWHCLVWNRARIWRTGRDTPTKNSQEYPPGSIRR